MLNNAIFISGAGQRIGLYLAKQFLQHTDYPVVFTYRSLKPGVNELIEMGAVGIQIDFNHDKAFDVLLDELQKNVASLRAVIHNASTWASDEGVATDFAMYDSMFKTHVEMPYRLNIELQPMLKASDSVLKDIVAITDTSVSLANDQHIAYLASKAALDNLTKNFAKKYAPEIKVNAIAPGLILFNDGDSAEYKVKRLTQSAIPIEPGAVVIWEALQYLLNSAYTTGISLPVDGGKSLI